MAPDQMSASSGSPSWNLRVAQRGLHVRADQRPFAQRPLRVVSDLPLAPKKPVSATFSTTACWEQGQEKKVGRTLLLDAYRGSLPIAPGTEKHLKGVLRATLNAPGSLVRARLAYDCMTALGLGPTSAQDLAIAIEYFHTASLLFDDLPAMDDATERRSRPCPHLEFGEAATMLGALAFISRGYQLLWGVLGEIPNPFRAHAAELVGECLGAGGVLEGQARDLHFADWVVGEPTSKDVLRVALGKTATLIRLTLVLPGIVTRGDASEIAYLDAIAEAWGLSYQIFDDCKDLMMSSAESGKTNHRDLALKRANYPSAAGWPATLEILRNLIGQARRQVLALQEKRDGWAPLEIGQEFLENELLELEARLNRTSSSVA